MHTAVPVSPKVRRLIQWIEWLLIAHCIVETISDPEFSFLVGGYWWLSGFIVAAIILSIPFPTHQPLRIRRGFITISMIVLLMGDVVQVSTSALFDLVIIKACLLLPRREVVITTALSIAARLGYFAWRIPVFIEEVRSRDIEIYLNAQNILLSSLIGSIVSAIFVVLLGFVFAAEQRGRRKAEMLALEVEALATKLERARIARDIHDSLGHSLTTLDVQLALAERYSQEINGTSQEQQKEQHLKLQQSIGKSKQLAAQCLAEARQSLQTMRDSSFDLPSALRTLGEQMRPSFLVNLQVQLPPLPQQLSYQLYLIVKESLVNVQKHAEATKVNLSLIAVDGNIELTLVDDGCGFDPEAAIAGYGLQGIRERSHLLGGTLTLRSQPAQGTSLHVTVPMEYKGISPQLSTLETALVL